MAALVARREASPRGVDGSGPPRLAMPEDVLRCLDALYSSRQIDLLHVRVMRRWGERGRPPRLARSAEREDALIWQEAMERLEWPLRRKGLLAAPRKSQAPVPERHAREIG